MTAVVKENYLPDQPHPATGMGQWASTHLHVLSHGLGAGHHFNALLWLWRGHLGVWLLLAGASGLSLLFWGRWARWHSGFFLPSAQNEFAAASLPAPLSLWQMAARAHPAGEHKRRVKLVKFMLRGWLFRQELERLWRVVGSPTLAPLLQADPGLLEKPMRPYLHAGASLAERVSLLRQHYAFMRIYHPQLIAPLLQPAGMVLGEYPDGAAGYRIVLRHDGTFRREGELSLSLLNGAGQRLYSCAFTIIQMAGEPALVIGALQGAEPAVVEPQQVIQQLTKAAFGVRPKSLMVMLAFMVAEAWQLRAIYGIPKAAHVYYSRRYRQRNGREIHADYDELWREFGAIPHSEWLWQLCLYERKPLEAVASKKRAMYRKRYEWLDTLAARIQQQLGASRH